MEAPLGRRAQAVALIGGLWYTTCNQRGATMHRLLIITTYYALDGAGVHSLIENFPTRTEAEAAIRAINAASQEDNAISNLRVTVVALYQ